MLVVAAIFHVPVVGGFQLIEKGLKQHLYPFGITRCSTPTEDI